MGDKISVLMPTYNRSKMINVAIKSILKQTYRNFELIIYDDGSTDKTAAKLKKRFGSEIIIMRDKVNRGCAYARNKLMEAATGVYACWQDSDDWSNINRLKYQYKAMQNGHKIVVTPFEWAKNPSSTKWEAKPSKCKRRKKATASTMFKLADAIPVDLARSAGGSDATWFRAMKNKHGGQHLLKYVLYYVRRHSNRIGVWKRSPKANDEWYQRMIKYR